MEDVKPVTIQQDEEYPQMYRLKWADGVLSADFYNLTRAKDILRNYENYRKNMKMLGNQRAKKAPSMNSKGVSVKLNEQGATHVAKGV